MFQALKKLTRRVLKGFGTLLPLLLATPAMAQWGAVTTKQDTSRFINGAFNNGLIMPHQQVIVGLLDTTITSAAKGGGNAAEIIVGSLLDYKDNCVNLSIVNGVASCEGSYEQWRELEKSTSWYQAARGDTTAMFPTNYAVTISTGKDSVNIWNRDTAELWMAFKSNQGSYEGLEPITGLSFKDGILRTPTTIGMRSNDFLRDEMFLWQSAAHYHVLDGIQTRNDSYAELSTGYPGRLAGNSLNAISVVRDPFGLKDNLGRPDHWWMVSSPSNGYGSLYNPHTNDIYDQAATSGDFNNVSLSDRGQIWMTYNNSGANDNLSMIGNAGNNTIFGQTADGWTPQVNYTPTGSGAQDLGWTSANNGVRILASNNRNSIVGENADNAYAWCDEGVYIISPMGGFGLGTKQAGSAKQRFSATVNAPVEVGDAVLTLALENNTTDSSPDANTMTANNSPGTVTAVFGQGYSSTVGSYLSHTGSAEFNMGTGNFYISLWAKSASATNPSADQDMVYMLLSGSDIVRFRFQSSGQTNVYISDDNGSTDDNGASGVDTYDGEWHHYVMTRTSSTKLRNYVDGVNVNTVTISDAAGSLDPTAVYVGANSSGAAQFLGQIDDLSIGVSTGLSTETIAKLHAEGRKKLALSSSYPSPVFSMATSHNGLISNNVADIDALDNGIWGVVFSDAATAQIFDGRIPIQEIAAPAGTVKSIALINNPGADSVGVVIGTTENLKIVQPSVNLRAAMAHQYQEPIHVGTPVVVDSAGINGIFWTVQDGIDAAANAGQMSVRPITGTYEGVVMSAKHSSMTLRCGAQRQTFTSYPNVHGALIQSTTTYALNFTDCNDCLVENCSFQTYTGGGSGGYSAVYLGASWFNEFRNNRIIDSDNYGIQWAGNTGRIINNYVYGSDSHGIQLQHSYGDGNIVTNNHLSHNVTYSIQAAANANYNVVTDNNGTLPFNDSGTGNEFDNNLDRP